MKKNNFNDYVSSNDPSLSTENSLNFAKFGLNVGRITKFEYNPQSGTNGEAGDAIDLTVNIGGKDFNRRFFDITKVYDKKNNIITDEDSDEYITSYNKEINQLKGTLHHIVSAFGVSETELKNALLTNKEGTFAYYAKIITTLAKKKIKEPEVDVFLQYQWTVNIGQDRTYLELPKNMKGGYFIIPCVKPVGKWVEERYWVEISEDGTEKDMEGLRYIDEKTNKHPFVRSTNFMTSKKAVQQVEQSNTKNIANPLTKSNNSNSFDWDN